MKEKETNPDLETEEQLVRRCQHGDLNAFKQVFHIYEHPLLRVALRMMGQQQDAEDAVQNTFLRLYRSIKQFQFHSKFSTYLFRILLNVCTDMLSKRKKMAFVQLDDVHPCTSSGLDLGLYLQEAILQLPARMRACFILFAVEELKQTEIADILNLSVGAVKSNIFHARIRLRKLLDDKL